MLVLRILNIYNIICARLLTKAEATAGDVDAIIVIYGGGTYMFILYSQSVVPRGMDITYQLTLDVPRTSLVIGLLRR